ncbi:hypothetical protein ZWY2020_042324 [Hordeum vulgare]|nr:hypothetical protein ZWY2020_042324 [Hordeum vulgare]
MAEHLRRGLGKHGQIAHVEQMPRSRGASFAEDDLLHHLTNVMRSCLQSTSVTRLCAHRAQTVCAAVAGKHIVVSTSTSSGKSLCYNVPLLESIVSSPTSSALYVFPTKALEWDEGRAPPRRHCASILACHCQFQRILSGLTHVIVDEARTYHGAFSCHTTLVLRCLRHLCADVYGRRPTFVFCTATLANLSEHVMELPGVDEVELVDQDASPHGVKHFVHCNSSTA